MLPINPAAPPLSAGAGMALKRVGRRVCLPSGKAATFVYLSGKADVIAKAPQDAPATRPLFTLRSTVKTQ
ncbi:hypothetical protein [Xylella fastidiosa]|uniref:hypothetical protein n=1 Tax=Xylella fastidiosa TaxID=2371 RepID=UPI003984B852